jgi:hypothetical protein
MEGFSALFAEMGEWRCETESDGRVDGDVLG